MSGRGDEAPVNRPMTGSYPGGPRPDGTGRGHLRSGEDTEALRDADRLRKRAERRRRAWIITLVVAIAAGVMGGVWAGGRTPADAGPMATDSTTSDIEKVLESERRKILLELWEMERAERGGRR